MEELIRNGKLVLRDRILDSGYVRIKDGVIEDAGEGEGPGEFGGEAFDAGGGWISPGLCDIHLHGCGGHWGFFGSDELLRMAEALAARGVTSFVPATVSLPHEQVLNSIREMKAAMSRQAAGPDFDPLAGGAEVTGARILGIQLEGPYLNEKLAGAHIPTVLRPPKASEIDDILAASDGRVRMMTLAPELEGGIDAIKRLSAENVVCAIGHSMATAVETRRAVDAGAKHFTHILNAVRPFHQREPGCAFTALVHPDVTVEMILDAKHVHVDAAKMVVRTKSPGMTVLVSDSIMAAGLGDGEYNVWGFDVTVKDGRATTAAGTMAGSVITLEQAVGNAMRLLELPPTEAFAMATANPLRVLGLDARAGALTAGMPADIAVFDSDMQCRATWVAGRRVFTA